MKNIYLFFLQSLSIGIFAQSPLIQWQATYGGANYDVCNTIRQTSDGGYILAGNSRSTNSGSKIEERIGSDDIWIIKIDSLGNEEWQNTIGGTDLDNVNTIEQTFDSGFILCGQSRSGISVDKTEANFGDADYWILKLDTIGNIVWQKTLGGTGADEAFDIKQTSDGGYIVGGTSNSDISATKTSASINEDVWILKLDSIGSVIWQKTIFGNKTDEFASVQLTSDGGYILGVTSNSNIAYDKTENAQGVSSDYWILKLDSVGNIEWQNSIGGFAIDVIKKVIPTSQNKYLAVGYSFSKDNGEKTEANFGPLTTYPDYWIINLDSIGNILWQKTIGGESYDYLHNATETAAGDFLIAGYSGSLASGLKSENTIGPGDYWLVKISDSGELLWENTIQANAGDGLFCVINTSDNGFALAGKSYSTIGYDKTAVNYGDADYWIIKYPSENCTQNIYYADKDSDNYGDAVDTIMSCIPVLGYVADASDCNDSVSTIHPYAEEFCNSIDDNCDGEVEEPLSFIADIYPGGEIDVCRGETVTLTSNGGAGDSYIWYKNGMVIPSATGSTYLAKKTGTYSVSISDSICNMTYNSDSTKVHSFPLPSATITPLSSTDICTLGSVILQASTGSGYQYKWFRNNIEITGEISSTYTATEPGNYKVLVVSSHDCTKYSAITHVSSSCRSSEFSDGDVQIIPNPVSDNCYINFDTDELKEIIILNSIGEIVFDSFLYSDQLFLDMSNYSAGIYFLKIEIHNQTIMKKIIKQ